MEEEKNQQLEENVPAEGAGTPDPAAEAPPAAETEAQPAREEEEEEENFAKMFESYNQRHEIKEGSVIPGKVAQISKDFVTIDIGYKSEGQVPVHEFMSQGQLTVNEGDEVLVYLDMVEDEEGNILLSKEKADKLKIWDDIQRAHESDDTVTGRIISRVKGGLSVDIGVKAFLPGSQVDLRPTRNLEKLIGQTFDFKIIKFNKRRGNIVLSRRALLERERQRLKEETLKKLEEGVLITGIVKNITEYGAFIDLGGIDGLLHITDMAWGRIDHPSERFSVGDEVTIKVLKFDPETERVSLGLKQTLPDPWELAPDKYPVGGRVTGKVVSLTDYGAFVELEEGVEGLIHVSEMSWTKRVKHPSKMVAVGDAVEALVLDIDHVNKRISLGMKQVEPNPWNLVEERYPPGTRITGKVRSITDFGIFVGLDEGIDGLVHISDISWTKRIKHPSEIFKKGQEVEAVVLSIDTDNERFSLGIKQIQNDPWDNIRQRYPVGSSVNCKVINITDFGVFVEIEEGVEGLIRASELARERVQDPSKVVQPGQALEAEIINIDEGDRKMTLSIKAMELSSEKADYRKFMENQGEARMSLGELLGDSLRAKAEEAAQAEKGEEGGEIEAEPKGEEAAGAEEESSGAVEDAKAEEAKPEETSEPAGGDDKIDETNRGGDSA